MRLGTGVCVLRSIASARELGLVGTFAEPDQRLGMHASLGFGDSL